MDFQHLIRNDSRWLWHGGKLIHSEHQHVPLAAEPSTSSLHHWIVRRFYAAQKNSRWVQLAIDQLIADLGPDNWGLNWGAGADVLSPRLLNLDLYDAEHMHIVNRGSELPFKDEVLDLVISQETLEHIGDFSTCIQEAWRVLKPGGAFYCQLPFIIGYHPGPNDYWRFTREAYPLLFLPEKWEIETVALSLGHGSGFYRILVEFMAVNASLISPKLYKPVKGMTAVIASPLQWLDRLTKNSPECDRIPGGYYCIARKRP